MKIQIIKKDEFERINNFVKDRYLKLQLIADMCRYNTLSEIKLAGSGHIGSSFSAMDIVTMLYYSEMNITSLGFNSPNRDIYFSSKGHDVPGLYSVLFSLGILPKEKFLKLRKYDGLCGHPDIETVGMEVNSGSLGMGISKAKGFAFAKNMMKCDGRVIVMTGDGELQEGQNFEALQSAVHQKINNLIVIVDHNKVQSDRKVCETLDLGDLTNKFKSFKWHVSRCDGHDFFELEKAFNEFKNIVDKPKILIADTIKGKGVSFMEHPEALKVNNGIYKWHSGAPNDDSFVRAQNEILDRVNNQLRLLNEKNIILETVSEISPKKKNDEVEFLPNAYGKALVEIAHRRKDLLVLDADLTTDCSLEDFKNRYPDRFIENGIAEQDMVSFAGGLALQGFLPVVNSFASFLSSRANEQIYNNSCEKTKIIYVCHYSGLIPAAPGHTHQSIRDIALFTCNPKFEIIQPCNELETKMALEYFVEKSENNCMLRLNICPSPRKILLPENYSLVKGKGVSLTIGNDAIIFSYGPVMLDQALTAKEMLEDEGVLVKVVNLPWLNYINFEWLSECIGSCKEIFIMEDHCYIGGMGSTLIHACNNIGLLKHVNLHQVAVNGIPKWGGADEVLREHGLDAATIKDKIMNCIKYV